MRNMVFLLLVLIAAALCLACSKSDTAASGGAVNTTLNDLQKHKLMMLNANIGELGQTEDAEMKATYCDEAAKFAKELGGTPNALITSAMTRFKSICPQ